jgi:hypothetical protein
MHGELESICNRVSVDADPVFVLIWELFPLEKSDNDLKFTINFI